MRITIEEWGRRYAAGETVSAVLEQSEYVYSAIEEASPPGVAEIAEVVQAVDAILERRFNVLQDLAAEQAPHVHRWNVETIPNPEGVIGPPRQHGRCACGAERDFTPITDEYAGRKWRSR